MTQASILHHLLALPFAALLDEARKPPPVVHVKNTHYTLPRAAGQHIVICITTFHQYLWSKQLRCPMSNRTSVDSRSPGMQKSFKRNAHIAYFNRCLTALPRQGEGHDSNRYVRGLRGRVAVYRANGSAVMFTTLFCSSPCTSRRFTLLNPAGNHLSLCTRITIAYFCLSALDLLGVLNPTSTSGSSSSIKQERRTEWIEWVWGLQARQ